MDLEIYGKTLFWIVSISLFLYEVYQLLLGTSSNNWKSHPAKVIDVKIHTKADEGTALSAPKIKYQYRYMGSSYKGNKVKYGDLWSSSYSKSSVMISGIAIGNEITVFVNPKRPSQSVLHKGYEGNVLWFLVFFCVFFFVAFNS